MCCYCLPVVELLLFVSCSFVIVCQLLCCYCLPVVELLLFVSYCVVIVCRLLSCYYLPVVGLFCLLLSCCRCCFCCCCCCFCQERTCLDFYAFPVREWRQMKTGCLSEPQFNATGLASLGTDPTTSVTVAAKLPIVQSLV